uniref:Ig-like domain-containing protein n=1 Tax=Lates calcarifer TaxID=8187 RepID=A0A4W6BT84_LATCA
IVFLLLFALTGASEWGRTHCQNQYCITLTEGEITAEAGLCVVIPCSFTTDYRFKPQNIVWYKCEPTKERCGDSDIIFHTNNIKIQPEFKGRVSLLEPDVSQKNCSIIINNLKESDSGSYQLRVNGVQFQVVLKPTVMVPPLTEGQQTTLICTAPGLCSGSDPEITWMWRGAGEKNSPITGNITTNQGRTSTLTFNPSAEHHSTEVTCKVSFRGDMTTEETVTLNVTCDSLMISSSFRTSKPVITGMTTVQEGDALHLTCSVDSSHPSDITWTKLGSNKNLQKETKVILHKDAGIASLFISNVTAEHSGQYICTAKHEIINVTVQSEVTVTCKCTVKRFKWSVLEKHYISAVCYHSAPPFKLTFNITFSYFFHLNCITDKCFGN